MGQNGPKAQTEPGLKRALAQMGPGPNGVWAKRNPGPKRTPGPGPKWALGPAWPMPGPGWAWKNMYFILSGCAGKFAEIVIWKSMDAHILQHRMYFGSPWTDSLDTGVCYSGHEGTKPPWQERPRRIPTLPIPTPPQTPANIAASCLL